MIDRAQPNADLRDTFDSKAALRVLVVSYNYPPQNYISAVRLGKLTKYLPEYGCEPWVLTLETGIFPSAGVLPVEIPECQIIRVDLGRYLTRLARARQLNHQQSTEPTTVNARLTQSSVARQSPPPLLRRILRQLWGWVSGQFSSVRFPDRALPWAVQAINKGTFILRDQPFDAILSSHGPPSSHLVAAVLARRFGLPWVADFRDLWTQNHIERRRGLGQWLEERLEQWVLRPATHLTTVSAPLAEQLRALHGKPVTVLPNGFDESDFEADEVPLRGGKFIIVYTGMIYPGKQDPSPLFEALGLLRTQAPEVVEDIELHFFGANPDLLRDLAARWHVADRLHVHPRVANRAALRWQQKADVLLLLEWNDPTAKGVYTGKVFEYLGARRPILATGPSGGVIEALLEETESGRLVNDAADVARLLQRWHQTKRGTGSTRLPARAEQLRPYTRRYQAGVLAQVLRRAVRDTTV